MVLICISLMASDTEHLFMSLCPLYVSLGEVSVQVFCPFLIGLFVFLEWNHVSSFYVLEIKPFGHDIFLIMLISDNRARMGFRVINSLNMNIYFVSTMYGSALGAWHTKSCLVGGVTDASSKSPLK